MAVIVHVPAPTMLTVEPESWHTVEGLTAKVTAAPEVLVADTVNGAAPKVGVGKEPMVIDCAACATVNDAAACGAAL